MQPDHASAPDALLRGKRVVLGLTGGVACYKAAALCRALVKAGAQVQVVMTEGAEHFITPTTMQALSGQPVHTSQWDARTANAMPHIEIGRQCDVVVVAPASADFLARLVHGRADELLSLLCLARPLARVPLLLAPAMNREMWQHPATQRNVAQLMADGATVLGVGHGEQACGEFGDGRMLEPPDLFQAIAAAVSPPALAGRHVLVTAGPTYEALDPVRGLTNLSSGKMGFALARAAREAGARVTLVTGPVAEPTPWGVQRVDVRSARDMHAAVQPLLAHTQVLFACAAVADWRPETTHASKIKKDQNARMPAMQFVPNPDILAEAAASDAARTGALYCVGFAAESHQLLRHAKAKRARKNVPLLVGNIGPSTFGADDNALLLVDAQGHTEWPRAPKIDLARRLMQHVAQQLAGPPAAP
jgi:phosphopantothenoylcysteine decarboxylase/phosphopantothenate--cysteine ligase